MAKKQENKDQIDKDLESLYARASHQTVTCDHCKGKLEIGGDFSEMARAMELRIKYEAIKRSKGGPAVPSIFSEEGE